MLPKNIFDFGDVTLESVIVKIDVFLTLFSLEKERGEENTRSHIPNWWVSRFDKLQHICRNILYHDQSDDDFRRLSSPFALPIFGSSILPPFVVRAGEFLQGSFRKFSLNVVSATLADESLQNVKEREFGDFFRGVHDAQVRKTGLGDLGL